MALPPPTSPAERDDRHAKAIRGPDPLPLPSGYPLLIPETTYGSDEVGLVCGYVFEPGQPGQPLGADEAMALAEQTESGSSPRDRFVWLHFNMSNAAAEPWLRQHVVLPETFYDLKEGTGSTRVETAEGALVAVVNDVLFDFAYDASHVAMVRMAVKPRFLVSARSKPIRSIDHLRAAVRSGETFRSPVHLLSHLLHLQAEVLTRIVRDATVRADTAEDNVLARRIQSSREELGRLRRVLVRLQRLLAPEPAALYRLLSRPPRGSWRPTSRTCARPPRSSRPRWRTRARSWSASSSCRKSSPRSSASRTTGASTS